MAGTLGGGVFRSTDGGLNWSAAAVQPTNMLIHSLTASGTTLLAGTSVGVFRSTDGGQTWSATTTQPSDPLIRSLTANATTAWAGTGSAGIWRSPL